MTGLIVLGTDTDAGKTAFSVLWLHAFGDRFAYWKPLETGESDTETVRRLAPHAVVFPPFARFTDPVAPPLAARRAGRRCPTAAELAAAVPAADQPLLIETFGSPLSPLNECELQVEFVRRLGLPAVLVVSSAVGAIGRTLQSLDALKGCGIAPVAVALVGPRDEYAETQIAKYRPGVNVVSVALPAEWTPAGFAAAATSFPQSAWERTGATRSVAPGHETQSVPTSGPHALRGDQEELLTADRRYVWHPYTPLRPAADPLPVVSAEAEFLHLADGRRLIDAVSSWWTILHGHRHPPLVAALKDAADTLDHVLFAGATHPPAVRLAELLLRTAPWPGGRVFFSDNGSTAVEVALKMAYQVWCHRGQPHRTLFVGFEHAYHGDTFGAMAVGRDRLFFGPFEPLLFAAAQFPLDPDRLDEFLARRGGQVAAVIVEPLVQGAGGMRMHSPATLRDLFDVAKRHGVLFIADEVMTGNRTGRRWAYQHAGIAPDLICASKTLAGGMMPLAATLAGPDVVAAFDTDDRTRTFFHGHSFTAHPLACAVGVVNEQLVADPALQERAADIGRLWERELGPLRGRPGVDDVRVCGSIGAVELDASGGYLADVGETVRRHAVERGVLIRPLGNVIYAMPPLRSSDDSLARAADVIRTAVRS